jgi:histidinol-phosphate aminotransferase
MGESVLDVIRPEVRARQAYHVATPPHRIKLNQNESAIELPDTIKEEILERLRVVPWSRYPQMSSELAAALRDALNLPKSVELLTGNGSNELMQALLVAVLEPGAEIVIPVPTFLLYQQFATILGASVLNVPLKANLTYDGERIREALEGTNARVVVLARPNNPTGTSMSIDAIECLLRETDALVVIDEAYAEFADDTVLELLSEHDNLVVLRTFSKALRSAGLRIGYLMSNASLTQQVAKVVPPFNTSIVSHEAALSIVRGRELLQLEIDATVAQRTWLMTALERIPGITPVPSQANFICFHTEIRPRLVFERLLDAGILVRDVSSYPLLSDCLRVSVGTPEENREFVASLNRIMEEQ